MFTLTLFLHPLTEFALQDVLLERRRVFPQCVASSSCFCMLQPLNAEQQCSFNSESKGELHH